MRIAYISHEFPPVKGGIATYIEQTSEIMSKRGHDITVFTGSNFADVQAGIDGIKIIYVKCIDAHDFRSRVVAYFEREHSANPFDVFESPEINGNGYEIKLKFPELPFIVRLHTPAVLVTRLNNKYNSIISKVRFIFGALRRGKIDLGVWSRHDKNKEKDIDYLSCKIADIIAAPSGIMKNWAASFWGIDPKKIKVIPNPIIPDPGLIRIPLQYKNNVVTYYGRLSPLKGVITLTEAIKQLLKVDDNVQFMIIGQDDVSHIPGISMESWMKNELKRFEKRIRFIGGIKKSELPEYLGKTDIVVLPSIFESFSYTCVESMCAARAVVGSNTTAMKELLNNGECGTLINPGDPKAIMNAILNYLDRKELMLKHGKAARQRALNEYSAENFGRQIEEMFSAVNSPIYESSEN